MARILIGCERSGEVRRAMRAVGHDAWSCDIEPADDGSPHHLQSDLLQHLHDRWDALIAFPPCTYLCRAGARWWAQRQVEQAQALDFVRRILAAPIPQIAVENPPGKLGSAIRPADQYIQPWEHGHPETKMTGLWLKGLPKLVQTNNVHARMLSLPYKERHRIHMMPDSAGRTQARSKTFPGIAQAMAAQWGPLIKARDPQQEPHDLRHQCVCGD